MVSPENVPRGLNNILKNEVLAIGDEIAGKGMNDTGKREEQKKGKQTVKERRKPKKEKTKYICCQDIMHRTVAGVHMEVL